MEYISSKNICLLIRDTLMLIDKRPIQYGEKVSYMVSKMLETKGGYELFELADIRLLIIIHDIGAYKTENINDMVKYETVHYMPHSIYGYLFLKYLSPLEAESKILLYHHAEHELIKKIDYAQKEIAEYINLAGRIELYKEALGESFQYNSLYKYADTLLSKQALDLFSQANKKYDILKNIDNEAYSKDQNDLLDYVMFNNEDKKKYLEMLMYCSGFRSEYAVLSVVTCVCICRKLGELFNLSEEKQEMLYFGALLHDIGMLAIPKQITSAARKLSIEEMNLVRTHVEMGEKILSNRLHKDVVEIASAHHERADGSGYPKGLLDSEMNLLQRILQVADTITGLVSKRTYREEKGKEEVTTILLEELKKNRYNKKVVSVFLENFDDIMEEVKTESNQILSMYTKLETQFDIVSKKFENNEHK